MKLLFSMLILVLFSDAIACTHYSSVAEVEKTTTTMNELDFTFHGKLTSAVKMQMSDEEYAVLVRRGDIEFADAYRRDREATLLLTFDVDRAWKGQVGTPFVVRHRTIRTCTLSPSLSVGDSYIIFGSHFTDHDYVMKFLTGEDIEKARLTLDRGY